MKNISALHKNWILTAIITALAIAMGCVFVACTKAQAESADEPERTAGDIAADIVGFDISADADTSAENYSRWLSDHYSADVCTRGMWLTDLLDASGIGSDGDVFAAAYKNGVTDTEESEPYAALTRRYVARTLVGALHYQSQRADFAADLEDDDADMSTVIYYGWFVPDDYGMVYPDALITADEYRTLVEEVRRYRLFSGRSILSFGDSIMYGMGNDGKGISDMVGEKYGMTVYDYAISGATFGVDKNRSHIPDQIKTAAKTGIKPDVILINGGTNDIEYVSRGKLTDGFDIKKLDERTFVGGFEYSAALMQKYWKDVPVIYVRAHDMNRVDNSVEREFGELALAVADKWDLAAVDIYHDSALCTEYDFMRDDYTVYKARLGRSDGVHPTALGYAKFYVPPVAAKLEELFS